MKDEQIKQLFQKIRTEATADATWRERTRTQLHAYISLHPHVKPMGILTRWMPHALRSIAILGVVMVVVITTGVSFAAQDSLPGDPLYHWKVQLESIQSAFLLSGQSKAAFEIQRTATRLHEVKALAAQPTTPASVKAEAALRLEQQVKTTSNLIVRLGVADPTQVSKSAADFQATIETSKEALATVASESQAMFRDAKRRLAQAEDVLKDKDADNIHLQVSQEKIALAEQQIANKNYIGAETSVHEALKNITAAQQVASATSSPVSSVEPSPVLSVSLSPSPQLTSQPTPKPTAVITPLPPEAVPLMTVEVKSSLIVASEPLVFTIRITNPYRAPMVLHWNTTCQVDYAIDTYPVVEDRVCTPAFNELTLLPNDSYTWDFATPLFVAPGTHTIQAELVDYTVTSQEFTVAPFPSSPPVPVLQNP